MKETHLPAERTWIVVADGGGARFFERTRRGVPLVELEALTMSAPAFVEPANRPTRVRESVGGARHGVESRVSPRTAAETRFLRSVAQAIDQGAERGAFDRVILCAPARALGVLRQKLSRAKERVSATIAKDLIHETAAEIEARLDEIRA